MTAISIMSGFDRCDQRSPLPKVRILRAVYAVAGAACLAMGACSSRPSVRQEPAAPTIMSKEEVDLQRRWFTLADRDFFGGPVNEWAAQMQAAYVFLMEDCQLQSIYRRREEPSFWEFRLIVFPSGHGDKTPFCVRIHEQDGTPWITKYWFGAYASDGLLSPITSNGKPFTTRECEDVRRRLEEIGFWTMPEIDTDTPQAMHEGHYFFEALAEGRYHCVDRGTSSFFEGAKDYLEFCVRFGNRVKPVLQY